MSCPLSGDESEATIKWVRAAEAALRDIDDTPVSMVNDSESLRHTITGMKSLARAALNL